MFSKLASIPKVSLDNNASSSKVKFFLIVISFMLGSFSYDDEYQTLSLRFKSFSSIYFYSSIILHVSVSISWRRYSGINSSGIEIGLSLVNGLYCLYFNIYAVAELDLSPKTYFISSGSIFETSESLNLYQRPSSKDLI